MYIQNTSISKSLSYSKLNQLNSSLLNEPQSVSLQREVDAYTRKVEQEKRRLFSIEETYAMVLEEYKEMKKKKKDIRLLEMDTQSKVMNAKIKNLENKTEQIISKHNSYLAENQKLQAAIDKLRKERVSHLDIIKKLQVDLENMNKVTEQKFDDIGKSLGKTKNTESQILLLKKKNEDEKKNYFKQFDTVQQKVLEEKRQRNENKVLARMDKFDVQIDLHTILKRRLKKLITKNKEKVKYIQQYQKILKIIDDAFTQIKQGSGITDIEEITNTFIKSEEQNYSLYTYVDILSQDIEYLQEVNQDLEKQCKAQSDENQNKERLQAGTPTEEKQKKRIQAMIAQKDEKINEFRDILKQLQPDLESILVELSNSDFNKDQKTKFDYESGFDVTEHNIEQYLSDLEQYINILIEYQNAQQNNNSINHTLMIDEIPLKEFKGPKVFNMQVTHDDLHVDAQKMLSHDALKEMALEVIEKKKIK